MCYLLLFVLIAGHIAANIIWISRNRAPMFWDPADYLALSQKYQIHLQQDGLDGLRQAYVNLDKTRAPLLPVLALPFYKIFGNELAAAMCVNYLAIVVLCLSIYGIGSLIRDRWLGLIAAYLTMLTPALFGLSRTFFVEFPMAAAIAATIYFCLRAHKLPFYASVPLIAISAAATMLLKVSFPIFIALPILFIILWQLFRAVVEGSKAPLAAFVKTLGGVVIALVIASTWYLPNLNYWLNFMMQNVAGARGAMYGAPAVDYLVEEARMTFLSYHILALIFLLVLSVIAWTIRRSGVKAVEREDTRIIAIVAVAAWFIGALYVCLTAADKDVRILFPALPALAILITMGYRAMAQSWRFVPATALLLFPLIAFFNFSFRGEYDATVDWQEQSKVDIMSADYMLGLKALKPYVYPPNGQDWKANEIVDTVSANVPPALEQNIKSKPDRGVGIAVIPNSPYLQPNWLNYIAVKGYFEKKIKYQMSFADPGYHDPALTPATCARKLAETGQKISPDAVWKELLKGYANMIILSRAQFMVVTDGWQGSELYDYKVEGKVVFTHGAVMRKITELMPKAKLFERLPGEITLPDGSHVIIYRNKYAGRTAPQKELTDFINLFATAGE
jgi:hypothetical protein